MHRTAKRHATTSNLIVLAAMAAALGACKKDADEDAPPAATGQVALSYGFHWGGPDFELGETYTDAFGHAVVFDTLRYFVSDLVFENLDGDIHDFENQRLLLSAESEGTVVLGTLTPRTLDSLHLSLGLNSTVNHADPATAAAPLNDTTMHWGPGTANGYFFLVVRGRVDDDATGVVDADDPVFSYRCGTDALRRSLTFHFGHSVFAGFTSAKHLHFQVDELFTGIDLLTTASATGAAPVNVQLMDNLAAALELE
ncbi:MAG: MbnP family protein [Flavobacteriales bacterium]